MSSQAYLNALRTTDYLKFLHWPEYITQLYLGKEATQDADTTISLIVFEWMQYDFLDEDENHIAIIYALLCENNGLLTSNLNYAATALTAAAMQCMVYKKQGLAYPKLINPAEEDILSSIQHMANINNPVSNNEQLLQQELILKDLATRQKKQLANLQNKLFLMLDLQEYIQLLEKDKTIDFNRQLRLGLTQALFNFIDIQKIASINDVHETIYNYFIKIYDLNPTAEERILLQKIMPLPEKNTLWNALSWGFRLFLPENFEVENVDAQTTTLPTKL